MIYRYIGLESLLSRGQAAAMSVTNEGANKLTAMASAGAPNKSGALAASLHTEGAKWTGTGAEAVVQTGAEVSDYAGAQHEGTGPHVIRAKNAKALNWPGAAHPVKQVNHPGNPPTKFLERPLLEITPAFLAQARAAMRSVF